VRLSKPASRSWRRRTPDGIASPRICCSQATTSTLRRNCLAMPMLRRR
jgi:hypothetical protein